MTHQLFRLRLTYLLAAVILLGLVFWPARSVRSEDFVFYLPSQRKLLAFQTIGGTAYLPLIPLLNLAGQVTALQEKRGSLRVWFGGSQLRFRKNKSRVEINKSAVMLPAPVVQVSGQWMVPAGFLASVLPRLTGQPVIYTPGSYRAFLQGVHPISFTVSLAGEPSGAKLVVHFTGKVSIQTASTNGKWVIFLGGAPIEP
ncbi:MAG: stalk domain-containing protein, partial [Terriglobia bacterium]